MERQNVMNVASAFALGSLAGAALALLYAPRAGEETRQLVRDKVRRGAELGREKLRESAEYTREKVREGAQYTREKVERGKQLAQNVMGKGEEMAESAIEYAESAAEGSFGERRRKPRTLAPEAPQQ
jgi:gas vesicle protein